MFKAKRLTFSSLLLTFFVTLSAAIPGEWKVYPTFDSEIKMIVDTSKRVYIQALGQKQMAGNDYLDFNQAYPFLFMYDKEADELSALSTANLLSGNIVSTIAYNPDWGYLLVVYSDGDIDLLRNDGSVDNIPGLKVANLSTGKNVNGITFHPEKQRAYLATDFGYIVIDDKRSQIAESHIFNRKLDSVGVVGDYVVAFADDKAYSAPLGGNIMSFADFSPIEGIENAKGLMPLLNGRFGFLSETRPYRAVLSADGLSAEVTKLSNGTVTSAVRNKDGYFLNATTIYGYLDYNGVFHVIDHNPEEYRSAMGSYDDKEYWIGIGRRGISSRKRSDDGKFTVTRDFMLPNAPSVFIAQDMAWSPDYGMLVNNHSINRLFGSYSARQPVLLCGLKNGSWVHYAPAYTNPAQEKVQSFPDGVCIDPDNPALVYSGSFVDGILRLNLSDPSDILHMAQGANQSASLPGFVEVFPTHPSWKEYCHFSTPSFDAGGNLWGSYVNQSGASGYGNIWVWPAADRKASRTSGWKSINIQDFQPTRGMIFQALKNSANRNFVLAYDGNYDGTIFVLNHNGSFDTQADDQVVRLNAIYDQDGSQVTRNYIFQFVEDPATGLVWALTNSGVFTFSPASQITSPGRVNRIKVSRNDGTNLADYLLDGVRVYRMAIDGQGRKWFATGGGGVVCTTADGKSVLAEITTEDSLLPSNQVYGIGYNPSTNSILVSTAEGMAEFFISGASSGESLDEVRAYPNPVRPEYLGLVTIDGLVDNAMVKILDASGSLVKELGLAEGGQVTWDVTNMEFKRVRSGVYYVAASSGPGDQKLSKVTKILVIN